MERLSFDIFRASSELVRSLKKEDQNFVVGVFGAASAAAMIYVCTFIPLNISSHLPSAMVFLGGIGGSYG